MGAPQRDQFLASARQSSRAPHDKTKPRRTQFVNTLLQTDPPIQKGEVRKRSAERIQAVKKGAAREYRLHKKRRERSQKDQTTPEC